MDPNFLLNKSSADAVSISMQKNDLDQFNFGKNAPPSFSDSTDCAQTGFIQGPMFKGVIYAKDTAKGSLKLLKRVLTMFFCSSTILIILGILLAVPLYAVLVGIIYIKECPIQRMIPIWLIIFGALLIIKNLSTLIQRIRYLPSDAQDRQKSSSTLLNLFDSFMALFLIIWFVCGNIWTYSNYDHVQYRNATESTYCKQLVYLSAFWTITSIYILICMACLIFCCTVCFTIFLPTKK